MLKGFTFVGNWYDLNNIYTPFSMSSLRWPALMDYAVSCYCASRIWIWELYVLRRHHKFPSLYYLLECLRNRYLTIFVVINPVFLGLLFVWQLIFAKLGHQESLILKLKFGHTSPPCDEEIYNGLRLIHDQIPLAKALQCHWRTWWHKNIADANKEKATLHWWCLKWRAKITRTKASDRNNQQWVALMVSTDLRRWPTNLVMAGWYRWLVKLDFNVFSQFCIVPRNVIQFFRSL